MTTQTARTLTVLLPLPSRLLSPNASRRGDWRGYSAACRRYRNFCGLLILAAWRQLGAETGCRLAPMRRAELTQHWICCRTQGTDSYAPRDVPNAVTAAAALYNAIVDAGILPDDDAAHLDLGRVTIERHTGHRRGQCQSGVAITVTEVL